MAGLRVFVSSTCYDLSMVRGQLRVFIESLGHEPVMSDFNDVLYDHRVHTHTSCVDEVAGCDVVVLLVGSRFGGRSFPEALQKIDFEKLMGESSSVETLKEKENISVTQLEILKAVEQGMPIYTFVDERVWHDHALYEKNKTKEILGQISFPSIDKPETSRYIFEFINFIRLRTRGNSLFPFSKTQDIESVLRKQWSALMQRLLNEQKSRQAEIQRMNLLSEQFDDLKAAILASIGTSNEREVARGVVRFRRLSDFLRGLGLQDHPFVLRDSGSFDELLHIAEIDDVVDADQFDLPERGRARIIGRRPRCFLVKKDGTFYEMRYPSDFLSHMRMEWDAFTQVPPESRAVIIDALSEMRTGPGVMNYNGEQFRDYLEEQLYRRHLETHSPDDDA